MPVAVAVLLPVPRPPLASSVAVGGRHPAAVLGMAVAEQGRRPLFAWTIIGDGRPGRLRQPRSPTAIMRTAARRRPPPATKGLQRDWHGLPTPQRASSVDGERSFVRPNERFPRRSLWRGEAVPSRRGVPFDARGRCRGRRLSLRLSGHRSMAGRCGNFCSA